MAQNYWSVYEEPKWPSHAPTLNILSSKYTGDFSDTDSELSDDGDYIALKSRFERKANVKFLTKERVSSIEGLTDEQKGIHYKRRAAETASAGLVDATIETIKRGKPYGLNCDTDVRDGWTPLMLAARGGHFELMNAFIRKTASLNCERDGVTLLMMVCSLPYYTSPYEKTVSMVAKLVRFGANVNLVDKRRKNALMYAAEVGNLLVVQALLPLCDKDYVDNQRWNALTWAVSNNQVQVVQFLYENGFAIDVVDVRGNTAVDIAVQKGFDSIIEIFPKAESDLIEEILGNQNLSFEDIFKNLKKGERPSFFENVCNFLLAVKCGHLIPIFSEKKVTLYDLLSSNEEDLKTFGVHLPFQRKRILTGLHRFHRHPYHPKSLHICIKDPTYR
ncbi:hypothetical protein ABEB36_013198 [Hypothenemus hampei]|uniref:SAM domain-containing protein n=1 Tax=Hypothenemus hampei TaxID=57062 RepID=A0ABD1E9W1_HYPHA